MNPTPQISSPQLRLGLFALLALVMAGTRVNHFGLLPDASWAVFFVAGFYLSGSLRWVFPSLMVLAVAVDYAVISASGQDFWAHYCVSPGYWFLLPAHFSLWMGGALLARYQRGASSGPALKSLGLLAGLLIASVMLCHGFAQGGFYWLSASVAQPSVSGWLQNYSDWLLPYLRTTAIYVGGATLLHVLVLNLLGLRHGAQTLSR